MSSLLLDMNGRPIPDAFIRKEAEEKLKDYVQKYTKRFQDWYTEHGAYSRPPIRFCLREREWVWLD